MKLTLVPTPLNPNVSLDANTIAELNQVEPNAIFLVESHKEARRLFLAHGLPRSLIERFEEYHEQNQETLIEQCIEKIKSGIMHYLLSDGGLPAFCDPGQKLVRACHLAQIKVTSLPHHNSISLALALSGIPHQPFYFAGFLNQKSNEREIQLSQILHRPETLVFMDTPYRFEALIESILQQKLALQRDLFIASELGSQSESLFFSKITPTLSLGEIRKKISQKPEFILILGPKNF